MYISDPSDDRLIRSLANTCGGCCDCCCWRGNRRWCRCRWLDEIRCKGFRYSHKRFEQGGVLQLVEDLTSGYMMSFAGCHSAENTTCIALTWMDAHTPYIHAQTRIFTGKIEGVTRWEEIKPPPKRSVDTEKRKHLGECGAYLPWRPGTLLWKSSPQGS